MIHRHVFLDAVGGLAPLLIDAGSSIAEQRVQGLAAGEEALRAVADAQQPGEIHQPACCLRRMRLAWRKRARPAHQPLHRRSLFR